MTIRTHLQTAVLITSIIASPACLSANDQPDAGTVFRDTPWNKLDNEQALDAMVKFAEMFVSEQEKQNLKTFDDLDFNVYTNQKWHELGRSHAQDVIVHWPDGRTTVGIDVHIKDLEAMFVFAPDNRIQEHPIRIADGKWTAVVGILEGTFSEPMPTADGTHIQPTGKPYRLMMATVGRWNNGVLQEEWLFWDNHAFMKQIGLAE